MSQTEVPQPYSESIVATLAVGLAPYDQSMEGGLNAYIATIPANTTINIYKKLNPFRKTLTLQNNDTKDLSLVILNNQNVETDIPLKANGGGYQFGQIIRGHVEQCINGFNMVQYLTTCEYQGIIKIKNANGTNVDLLIIEAV